MAKKKLDLKSLTFDYAAIWLGAGLLSLVLFIAFKSLLFWALGDLDKVEGIPAHRAEELFEKLPQNKETFSVFDDAKVRNRTKIKEKEEEKTEVEEAKRTADSYWTYSGEAGPQHWSKLSKSFDICNNGKAQSPIDLRNAVSNLKLPSLNIQYKPTNVDVYNDGRNAYLDATSGSHVFIFNEYYELQKIYFRSPSEHWIVGKKYDFEIQFYHKNRFGNQLIVAVLAAEGRSLNPVIENVLEQLPREKNRPGAISELQIERLLPKSKEYFSYDGSQTFPPCAEEIRWIVLKEPIYIAVQQVDQFLSLVKFNARPIQSALKRKIEQNW